MKHQQKILSIMLSVMILGGCNSNSTSSSVQPPIVPPPVISPLPPSDDIDKIESNIIDQILNNTQLTDSQVSGILSKYNATAGTFTDITYPAAGSKDLDTTQARDVEVHIKRLAQLSTAYNLKASRYYRDADLRLNIKSGSETWLTLGYESDNWWWRMIGFPQSVADIAVLMNNSFITMWPELNQDLGEYLLYGWHDDSRITMTGANLIEIGNIAMQGAVILKEEETAKEIQVVMNATFSLITDPIPLAASEKAGLQVDYSYSQHTLWGRQLYLGNYGGAYFKGVIDYIHNTVDTDYGFDDSKIKILEDSFLEGSAWSIYEKHYDENVNGRFIGARSPQLFTTLLNETIALNTPQKAALVDLSTWMTNGNSEGNALSGNKMFWTHDYMVHRRENYYTSVRMTSTRTTGNEEVLNVGKFNLHTGDNVNYIMVDGDEYSGVFYKNAAYNWRKIPGTTAQQVSIANKPLLMPHSGRYAVGGNEYAGGVSDGTYGAAAVKFRSHGVSADKSWFFFDDFYVALGKDIKATTSTETGNSIITDEGDLAVEDVLNNDTGLLTTTINQANYNEQGFVATTPGTANYYLYNDKVGYVIEGEASDISVNTANNIFTLEYLNGNFDGAGIINEYYEYSVYPDTTPAQLATYANNKAYRVYKDAAHNAISVYNNDESVVYVVFYGDVDSNNDGITDIAIDNEITLPLTSPITVKSDKAVILMLRDIKGGSPTMTVADPNVNILGGKLSIQLIDSGNTTLYPITLPKDIYAGKSVNIALN